MSRPGSLLAAPLLPAVPALACDGRIIDGPAVTAPACVPETAQRIVALDPFYTLQMALLMDLPVVAAAWRGAAQPQAIPGVASAKEVAGLAPIGEMSAPDLEAVIAAAPDLIVGDAYSHGAIAGQLAAIAPTILVASPDWKVYARTLAEAADAVLAPYEAEAARLREALSGEGPVSFVRITAGGIQLYVDGPAAHAPMEVLRDAGLERPPSEIVEDDTVLLRPTMEGPLGLEGEWLIYTLGGAHHTAESEALHAEVTGDPLRQAIPAVAAGRAHRVEPQPWMSFGGPHSAMAILDDLRGIYGLPDGG